MSDVKVGRSSPWAAPLIHMIPQRVRMEILLTGNPISAHRAYEIGLVNRPAEPDELLPVALDLASTVLAGAPLSVRAARETVMLATEMGRPARRGAGLSQRGRAGGAGGFRGEAGAAGAGE
ncbi:enoyl-CoA hydratase-related protein [Nocardia sp. NPDC002869]|uniref:enoyl-CoA hydratase-related protein n=1 Tax=Nocardia sp. NPDC002869 TaxID=3161032 RepID=UPI00398CCE8F